MKPNKTPCKRMPVTATKKERQLLHIKRMLFKESRREDIYRERSSVDISQHIIAASINRRTGKPHEHFKERTRRIRRKVVDAIAAAQT